MYSKIILFILLPIFGFSQSLTPRTIYLRDYATNNKSTASGNQQSFTTTATSQTVTDIDGNIYNTVQIGTQVWFSENLKTSRYRNGGLIPNVVDDTEWEALTTGACSWYNNDAKTYDYPYGNLYNWYSTLGDTLCPTGWSVPSLSDLKVLTDYLGGECVAEGKMKSNGIAYWNDPNTGATNESGFSALPGGFRGFDGSFNNIRKSTYIWSTTEFSSIYAWYRALYFDDSNLCRNNFCGKSIGASVRCLKD